MTREKEKPLLSIYRWADATIRDTLNKKDKVKYNPPNQSENNVCIILDKGMGDFILFAHYLRKLIDLYGNKLYIIADTYNIEFVKAYIPEQTQNIIILKQNSIVTIEGRQLNTFYGIFTKAIIPMNSIAPRTAELLRILSPNEIISLGCSLYLRKYSRNDYDLFKHISSSGIKRDFYCKMHREFLLNYYNTETELALDEPHKAKKLIEENYFVVNISASSKVHLPKLSFYLDLARELSEKYHMKAVLIGDCSESEKNQIEKKGFDTQFLNLRDMNTTISLCSFNAFTITTDTGIYHLAMSIHNNFPVFVINWGYTNILFEPYPDELDGGRLHYIQLFENCDCCPFSKKVCWINMRLKRTVRCIKEMNSKFAMDAIKKKSQDIGTIYV